jgi:hypothetical protein
VIIHHIYANDMWDFCQKQEDLISHRMT